METLATMNTVPNSGTPDTTPPPVAPVPSLYNLDGLDLTRHSDRDRVVPLTPQPEGRTVITYDMDGRPVSNGDPLELRINALLAKFVNERAAIVRNYQRERERIEREYQAGRAKLEAERTAALRRMNRIGNLSAALFILLAAFVVASAIVSYLHK